MQKKKFVHQFYKNNHINLIITIIILAINAVFMVSVACILQRVFDISVSGKTEELIAFCKTILLYAGLVTLGKLLERFIRNHFLEVAIKQYKEYAFNCISDKSISSFSNENTSKYISLLTNDVNSIEKNYLNGTLDLILNILYFVGAVLLMIFYNPLLTVAAIGLSMVSLMISIPFGGKLAKEESHVSVKNESFVNMAKDLLSGFSVIKSFKAEPEVKMIFDKNNANLEGVKCRRRKTEALINLIALVIGFFVLTGVMLLGAYLTIKGQITAGVLVAFIQLMNYMVSPMQTIPTLLANRKAAGALIDKLADAVSANAGKSGTVKLDSISSGITFDNVTFGYDENESVLKNINISFEAGKSYAIVGASGSGKSTLLNLLMGSYENYEGNIAFDKKELHTLSAESLYDMISIIHQNVFVFDSSIVDNITMFKKFTTKRIENAINRANLSKLIEEKGSDYRCGENGNGLSGGEKQRISIARSFLRNAPILLMDEATSSLDTNTAYLVENAILGIDELTRIVVTHKLDENMLRRYDRIVVMNNGKVCENDTFDNLMAEVGYFYSLYNVTKIIEPKEGIA